MNYTRIHAPTHPCTHARTHPAHAPAKDVVVLAAPAEHDVCEAVDSLDDAAVQSQAAAGRVVVRYPTHKNLASTPAAIL